MKNTKGENIAIFERFNDFLYQIGYFHLKGKEKYRSKTYSITFSSIRWVVRILLIIALFNVKNWVNDANLQLLNYIAIPALLLLIYDPVFLLPEDSIVLRKKILGLINIDKKIKYKELEYVGVSNYFALEPDKSLDIVYVDGFSSMKERRFKFLIIKLKNKKKYKVIKPSPVAKIILERISAYMSK